MLPALESIISDASIRGGLEHTLSFMYGLTPEEMINDPEIVQRISTTTYFWRIIGPLLLNLASNNTITLSGEDFYQKSIVMTISGNKTPQCIKNILDGIK